MQTAHIFISIVDFSGLCDHFKEIYCYSFAEFGEATFILTKKKSRWSTKCYQLVNKMDNTKNAVAKYRVFVNEKRKITW